MSRWGRLGQQRCLASPFSYALCTSPNSRMSIYSFEEHPMCPAATLPASIDVLIVEDDPIIRLAVRQLLEDEGYTCAEMEDGRELLDIALQCHPRLVLLDLMMPEVDGFTAAEQLRSHPGTQ